MEKFNFADSYKDIDENHESPIISIEKKAINLVNKALESIPQLQEALEESETIKNNLKSAQKAGFLIAKKRLDIRETNRAKGLETETDDDIISDIILTFSSDLPDIEDYNLDDNNYLDFIKTIPLDVSELFVKYNSKEAQESLIKELSVIRDATTFTKEDETAKSESIRILRWLEDVFNLRDAA